MEDQTFRETLKNTLKAKADESTTYRKSLLIYESILESASTIPNFETQHAQNDSSFALFMFGSVYKLLLKDDSVREHNFDSLLLLINNTLPQVNVSVLKQTPILKGLQLRVHSLLKSNIQKTPLTIRLAISILYHTFINTDKIAENSQATEILFDLFNSAVDSHRTSIMSKETGKMLCHLVKNDLSVAKILSKHVNLSMQKWENVELYLNNVRDVIMEFDLKLINDIAYRVVSNLTDASGSEEEDENYLTQTYFFLEKLASKLNSSILEDICQKLIHYVPSFSKSDKIIFCYLQALHGAFSTLIPMNEKKANKYLASIISNFQQFLSKGGRIEKLSANLLKSILENCVRKSLWIADSDPLNFENMGLEQDSMHSFGKVVCLLKNMISTRYTNLKTTASILVCFFDSLDVSAIDQVIELINEIVINRNNFDDNSFRKLFHSIFNSMSIREICKLYPIQLNGDIGDENYEMKNNLWLAHCVEKFEAKQYEKYEDFNTFMDHFFHCLIKSAINMENTSLHPVRRQGFKSINQMFWRSLKIFCMRATNKHSFQDLMKAIQQSISLVSDSTLEHISMALEHLCLNLYNEGYTYEWAGKMIGLLAKKLDLSKNNSKQILKAMKYLAMITDRQLYLNQKFDLNITKLLQEKEQIDSEKKLSNYLKKLQILIAISNGIDFSDPTVIRGYANGQYSRQQLVKILIQMLIGDNQFQKKAYKYILEIIPLLGTNELPEMIEIVENNEQKINSASKHYRLAILNFLWERIANNDEQIEDCLEFIKKYLPEILIAMRETNQRTRKQADNLFNKFCKTIIELDLMNSFMEIVCVGLTSQSVQMKIASINGLALISEKKFSIDLDFLYSILELVMMLLHEKRAQLYKAVLQYCRKFIQIVDKERLVNQILPSMINQFFEIDEVSKLQHRSVLKHFLLKMAKKHGKQTIEKMIPINDRKMLNNAIKTDRRERRKKRQLKMQRRAQQQQQQKQKVQQSSDQSGSEKQQEKGMDIEESEELQQLNNTQNLLLKYDLDKENFHFQEDKINIRLQKRNLMKEKSKETDGVSFNESGMMVVKEGPIRQRQTRQEMEQDEGKNQKDTNYENMKKKKKLNDIHLVKESGDSFKSKRAGGDVRTKDKPQPYAFIQFNSKALNKRFKKRAEKVFDKIFERKEGGLKGIKSKIASKMH